jgi:hypothetical protein
MNFKKAAVFALTLVFVFVVVWEWNSRQKGYETSFDDSEALWAEKRKEVYDDPTRTTVFVGSSRIKFDLDIPTWETITGEKAVQLALTGSSPVNNIYDLANDEKFKGKLIIDVTEPLFFSVAPHYSKKPLNSLKYYKNETPTQNFSYKVGHFLETQFAFLNKEYLSINSLLFQVPLPPRPKIFKEPYFPPEFELTKANRQCYMADSFVKDTNLQKQMHNVWLTLLGAAKQMPPPKKEDIEAIFTSVRDAVEKIKSRGGEVIFVRTPSSGVFLEIEKEAFPREAFWDKLLTVSNSKGIHFLDYPETASLICPEWSHLTPEDAIVYTKHFIKQLEEQEWPFAKKLNNSTTSKY